MNLADTITIVIPTSPIPSNPSTSLFDNVVAGIRKHLPACPILIQADGVRPEQEKFRDQYQMFLYRLDDSINAGTFGRCTMRKFPEYSHQARMMKMSLAHNDIQTPLLFYLEHDFLMLAEYVDWKGIAEAILSKEVNLIRLYYWSSIVPQHWDLMIDKEPIFIHGVPLLRTVQWSQQPHIASIDLYRAVLSHFSEDCRTMVEDRIYGIVSQADWSEFKCSVYAPMPYLKRMAHLHGREEEPKFEEKFVF